MYIILHCTWPVIPHGILKALWRFSYALYANWLCIKDFTVLDIPADSITSHYIILLNP